MPQSLIQLPETVDITGESDLHIRNHEVVDWGGLLYWILTIINRKVWKTSVTEMEKHGISYEMVVECCVHELEHDTELLTWMMMIHYNVGPNLHLHAEYSERIAGRKIAGEIVDAIRTCNDWTDLHDTMQQKSGFSKDMAEKIREDLRTWLKA